MKRPIRNALVLAGLQLAVALLATAAHKLGYIDGDLARRITMVTIGLVLLVYGNFESKVVSRSARVIAIQRFVGWSLSLGALAWIGIWVFAPLAIANLAAMGAVALAGVAAVTYCFRARPRTTT